MRKIFTAALLLFLVFTVQAQDKVISSKPVVITGCLIKITKQVRDLKSADKAIHDIKVRDIDGINGKEEDIEQGIG